MLSLSEVLRWLDEKSDDDFDGYIDEGIMMVKDVWIGRIMMVKYVRIGRIMMVKHVWIGRIMMVIMFG